MEQRIVTIKERIDELTQNENYIISSFNDWVDEFYVFFNKNRHIEDLIYRIIYWINQEEINEFLKMWREEIENVKKILRLKILEKEIEELKNNIK